MRKLVTIAKTIADAVLGQIRSVVGAKGVVEDPAQRDRYMKDWHGLYSGEAELVVLPASTMEVSKVVAICAQARIPVFPQGGHTGLCGGAVPSENGRGVVLAMGRMNRIRALDPTNFTITADA